MKYLVQFFYLRRNHSKPVLCTQVCRSRPPSKQAGAWASSAWGPILAKQSFHCGASDASGYSLLPRNLEQQIWDNAVSRQVEVLEMWRMAVVSHVSSTPGCAEQGKSRRNFHDLHCLASTDRQRCTPSEDCNLILLVHVISVIPCLTGHVACTKSTGAFLANGWTTLQPWHRPATGVKSAEVNIWF